mgnify:CR=1 FL=1
MNKFKPLYELAAKNGITVDVSSNNIAPGSRAYYTSGYVTFNPYTIAYSTESLNDFTEVLNHEIIHGILDKGVKNNYKLNKELEDTYNLVFKNINKANKEVKAIIDYIEETREQFIEKDYEGATMRQLKTSTESTVGSLEEFVTYAFTNPEFAKFLDSITVDEKSSIDKTVLDRLKEIIRNYIKSLTKGKTALDSVNNIVNNHLDLTFNQENFLERNKKYNWGFRTSFNEDITRQQKFTPEEVYADAGLSKSEAKKWKEENRKNLKMPYPEEALKANKDYRDKKISYEEKNEIIERKFPITPLESVPKLPTIKEVVLSLDSNKLKNGVIGLNKSIADGEIVSSRLDIPAYLDFGIYVDTIHGPKGKGVLGYGQTVVLTANKDRKVTFNSKAKLSLNVAATQDLESKPKDRKDVVPGKEYKQAKNPFAVMEGAYKNESPESVVKRAKAALKSDEWVQVGFNPYRHAFFYDKANSRPVESATEIIQVGALVMAKGVKYGKPLEFIDKSGGIVRFQKDNDPLLEGNRPTIDQIIERGNEINASKGDLKQAFSDYGYSPKQVLENKQRKEGILPNRYSILRAASSFYKRWLSAKSFMPRSTFKAMEIMDASVASDKQDISKNIKDFDKLTKKYKGEERENLMSRFDAFMRGDKNVDLPEGLKKVATSMRLHIDSLSQSLINSGLVDADTAEKIKANMGEYLTRSYRVYDSNNWKDQVNDQVIQKAKNILRQQYGSISKGKNISLAEYEAGKEKISVEEALEILVDNRINDLLSKEGATNFVKGSNLGSKDLSILRERQDIPPEIMALMGVYKDPGINYAKTILKMSALAANHNFLSSVKKNGMGVFLFEKNSVVRPKGTVEIFPKGSKTSNPLNGLYAPEAIAKEFRAEEKRQGMKQNDPLFDINALVMAITRIGQKDGGLTTGYAQGGLTEMVSETETMDGPSTDEEIDAQYGAGASENAMNDAMAKNSNALTYDELRLRLPPEVSDDVVKLLSASDEALLEFSNISTQQDVNEFNVKYGVELVLPQA